MMDPVALGERLEPFTAGRLTAWQGLPEIRTGDLAALLGEPLERTTVKVGAYPAQRWRFQAGRGRASLVAFTRDDRVFMVEVSPPPDRAALEGLPEPTAVLPQEISVEGAYAHEFLYAERGLVVTLAQQFGESEPRQLLRCRGIRPLEGRKQFGPELYMPLDTDIKW